MGKKARNKEQRQIEDLMAVHPLQGRNRRGVGTTGLPGNESGMRKAQSEKSWAKCNLVLLYVKHRQPRSYLLRD